MKYAIHYINEDLDNEQLSHLMSQMPKERIDAYRSINHLEGKLENVMAYHLLCDLLKQESVWNGFPSFSIGEHGKPSLNEYSNIQFNLSHCRGVVASAIHSLPIGIDVERERKLSDALIRKVCSNEELNYLDLAENRDLAFLRLWTRKEAFVKMTGTGIQDDINQLGIPLHDGIFQQSSHNVKIESHLLPSKDGWVTICYYV